MKEKMLPLMFFSVLACLPAFALFWDYEILFIKTNWFPLIPFALAGSIVILQKSFSNNTFRIAVIAVVFYALLFLYRKNEIEPLVRFVVAMMPLLLIHQLETDQRTLRLFFNVYMTALLPAIVISVLQLMGYYEVYDGGTALGFITIGRISGGYLKPNNLAAFFFPAYLYGFHLLNERKKVPAAILIIASLLIVLISGLRTTIIIYLIIFPVYFFTPFFSELIRQYYKYHLPLLLGLGTFAISFFLYQKFGFMDGLRYRLPMWQAQADHFFNAPLHTILFGFGQVSLPDTYGQSGMVRSLIEAHNNSFRIVVTFGVFGFLLYCLLLRAVVMNIWEKEKNEPKRLFLKCACVLYFMIYAVTNEPAFYASITWCTMLWIFIKTQNDETAAI
jgi:hypothetical protein